MATVDPNTQLTTYDYDANGNMVEKVVDDPSTGIKTTLYTYDAENRLATVDDGSGVGGVVSYTYDADGIRTSKLVGVTLTTYVVDKNRPYAQVLEERLEVGGVSTVVKHYVYGHDLISQTDRPGDGQYPSTSYFHYDGQMSTRALSQGATAIVDPTPAPLGSVIAEYSYDAFGSSLDLEGNPLPAGSTSATDYLYTGEQHDANAGFYYLRARYYSPGVGRFITRDSFAGNPYGPLSLHRYAYAHANPINGADPSGSFFVYITQLTVASVQAVLRNHKVAVATIVADRVGAFLDAVVLVLEIVAGGTVPLGLAAGLIASIVPFGWLFRHTKIVGNILEGASEKLTQIFRQMKTGANRLEHRKAVEIVGELGAIATAEMKGFRPTSFPARYHGIDGVMQQGDRFLIIEAKGGGGKLGITKTGEQLSQGWIDDKIRRLGKGTTAERKWAKDLTEAKDAGRLDVLSVSTPIVGNVVGDPVFMMKTYDNVGKTVFDITDGT